MKKQSERLIEGLLLSILAFALSGCGGGGGGGGSTAPTPTGGVTGYIYTRVSARSVNSTQAGYMPLGGVTVTCGGVSGLTGNDGKFNLTKVPVGNQTCSAVKPGYTIPDFPVNVPTDSTVTANNEGDTGITGVPSGTGVLVVNSTPTGATIIIDSGAVSSSTLTNAVLNKTATGAHDISVSLSGYEAVTAQSITLTQGATATVTFALTIMTTGITISPTSASLTPNGTQQFSADCTYSDSTHSACSGNVTWTSSNTGVATISNSGLLTALLPGMTTITAARNQSGTTSTGVSVTVACPSGQSWFQGSCQNDTLQSITIASPASSVAEGATLQFSATCTWAMAGTGACPALTWSSSDTGKAAINASTGLLTAVTAGATNVSASGGGKNSNSVSISVTGTSRCTQVTATLGISGNTPQIMGFDMDTHYGTDGIIELASVTPVSNLLSKNFTCTLAQNKAHFNCYTNTSGNSLATGYSDSLVNMTFTVLNNAASATFEANNFNTSNSNGDLTSGYTSGSITYNRNVVGSCDLGALTVSK